MQLLVALIQPQVVDKVLNALYEAPVYGATVSEAKGFGRQFGLSSPADDLAGGLTLRPKIQLLIAVPKEDVERVVSLICQHARTGNIGDGKIFILPLTDAIRVRTGERGETVL